jgi:endonuclease/exonuclease/phosphatase family metal-dependent hydrolase
MLSGCAMIKLASYNMRKAIGSDRVHRPDRILDVLGEIDADVVALQEADRRFGARATALPCDLIEQHSDYVPVKLGRRVDSIGWHGNAILVRKAMAVTAFGHIDLPTLEPRGGVFVELTIDTHRLRVVGMHLDLSGLWRRKQARHILAALAERKAMPTVMMGDLNEWRRASGCLHDFASGFRFAPTGKSFPARRPIARLDRIMADSAVNIIACGVHHSLKSRHASDHLPVWAQVEVN